MSLCVVILIQNIGLSIPLKKGMMDMREQRTKAQVKNENYKIIPTACRPPTPCYKSTTPHLSHFPTICNKNTMDIEFLGHMRQSDKCGSVRNDDIFKLHLGESYY